MDRSGRLSPQYRAAMQAGGFLSSGVVLPTGGRERRESVADAAARRAVPANAVLWRDEDERLAAKTRSSGQCEASAAADALS